MALLSQLQLQKELHLNVTAKSTTPAATLQVATTVGALFAEKWVELPDYALAESKYRLVRCMLHLSRNTISGSMYPVDW
jgi:hypothetical protein